MSLCTTIVAGSIGVAFPGTVIGSIVIVSVESILICVHTLVLMFSVVCELLSVWNVVVWATGHCGIQRWALVSCFCEPGVDLLIHLRCGIFKSNSVPVILAILAVGRQGWCYERVCVTIITHVDYEQGVCCCSWPDVRDSFIVNEGETGLGCFL